MAWYDKLSEISDTIVKLDQKLGIKKIIQYLILILVFIGIINIKSITKWAIETISDLSAEIHDEQMEKRDQLLSELIPELRELLGATGADRALFFEYHNSKENVIGIPFKYIELVIQTTRYGVPYVPVSKFRDVNTGRITLVYEDLKTRMVIPCTSRNVSNFQKLYPGNHEYFVENAGSQQQIFVTVPGVHHPIGMIVLEWTCPDKVIDEQKVTREVLSRVSIINGLILSYK
jgi:hypothetical protein